MSKILLIDDCMEVVFLVKNCLRNHELLIASNICDSQEIINSESISLFIIDVDLPDGSGFDLCSRLNNSNKHKETPKIFLSSYSDTAQKVFGFSCGGDDYITKPFSNEEFVARVENKIKYSKQSLNQFISCFEFDTKFQTCFLLDGSSRTDLKLTQTEYRLLFSLVKNDESPLSRRDLARIVWKENGLNIETRGIDSHISHIRKKLKDKGKCLISIYGLGYAFTNNINKNLKKTSLDL